MRFVLALALLVAPAAFAADNPAGKPGIKLSVADLDRPVLQGTPAKPGDKGVRLIALDFWASWCEPCKESLPYYSKIQKKYEARGLRFIAVNADENEADAKAFMKTTKIDFPVVWDKGHHLIKKLNLDSIPMLVFVAPDGRVLEIKRGFTKAAEKAMPKLLEELLADKGP